MTSFVRQRARQQERLLATLEPLLAALWVLLAALGSLLAALGPLLAALGPLWSRHGAFVGSLGGSWGAQGRLWGRTGATGGRRTILVPFLARESSNGNLGTDSRGGILVKGDSGPKCNRFPSPRVWANLSP